MIVGYCDGKATFHTNLVGSHHPIFTVVAKLLKQALRCNGRKQREKVSEKRLSILAELMAIIEVILARMYSQATDLKTLQRSRAGGNVKAQAKKSTDTTKTHTRNTREMNMDTEE